MKLARTLLLLAVAILAATSPSAGKALPGFEALFVFGDSLSDIGNDFIGTTALGMTPALPPSVTPHRSYFNRRFSNGPVAVEYLWLLLSQPNPANSGPLLAFLESPTIPSRGGLSFAFGGANTNVVTNLGTVSVPGLGGQVALFVSANRLRPAPRKSLYVVMAGANDYLPLADQPLSPEESVGNIMAAVTRLYANGARHIMVVNQPDLGKVPLVANDPELSRLLTLLSQQHNVLLAQALADLHLPGLTLYPVDINGALQLLPGGINTVVPAMDYLVPVAAPNPPTSLCLFINPVTCPDVTTFEVGDAFFYWDVEHPTTAVHSALGRHLYESLQ